MKVIIDNKEFDLDLTPEQLAIINHDPMIKVYAYHNTTKEAFDKLYENIPLRIKALAQEELIAKMYNKGVAPDWDNEDQRKYTLYFDLTGEAVTLDHVSSGYLYSDVPPSLVFLSREAAEEAAKKFIEVYKVSRNPVEL